MSLNDPSHMRWCDPCKQYHHGPWDCTPWSAWLYFWRWLGATYRFDVATHRTWPL